MSYKIKFIIPHFGKFNNYFPLWLLSCSYNPGIEWLIFTDDKTAYNYPENVQVFYTTFDEIVKKIQSKFDFKIVLDNPYQLCEFKVAYGEVFNDHLKGYQFWGHCDTDVIWGNLKQHLSDEILKNYSKISWRGHLTLYKNNEHINSLYRLPVDGVEFYKHAFSNSTGYPLAPDERIVNYIFQQAGEKIYKDLMFADLKIRSYNFQLLHFPASEDYKNQHQVFLWDKGTLFRIFISNNSVLKEDFAYIHFLKRPMKIAPDFAFADRFLIVPNCFINYVELNPEIIIKYSRQHYYWTYLFERLKPSYFLRKIFYIAGKNKFKRKYKFLPLKTVKFELKPYSLNEI